MTRSSLITTAVTAVLTLTAYSDPINYPIVDTGQVRAYNNDSEIPYPDRATMFYGQDAQYVSNPPSYRDNGNGTITDRVTGLTWQQDPGKTKTLKQAISDAKTSRLGGHHDWRVPTIKELYSLVLFSGIDPDPMIRSTEGLKPFIDTKYFKFRYGNLDRGERIIDSQYGSRTRYVSTTMHGDTTLFGVNFADGRIKGYGLISPRTSEEKQFYFIFVRGNPDYGMNQFHNNQDGTITDKATGLTWMQVDSGALDAGPEKNGGMTWKQALNWAESLTYANHSDWRLPDIKELQSIVDYSRSPKTTGSPAIDPIFKLSKITDEGGNRNYPFLWSSTTHCSAARADAADYIAFGEALGWMPYRRTGKRNLLDVHGAGSQRSDPKEGDPGKFPYGRGPQGDVIRIYNHALCVRGGTVLKRMAGPEISVTAPSVPAPRRQGMSKFIKRLDKNRDGKLSPSEFDGPSHHFRRLDKNQDGFLSGDEAPKGPPPRP